MSTTNIFRIWFYNYMGAFWFHGTKILFQRISRFENGSIGNKDRRPSIASIISGWCRCYLKESDMIWKSEHVRQCLWRDFCGFLKKALRKSARMKTAINTNWSESNERARAGCEGAKCGARWLISDGGGENVNERGRHPIRHLWSGPRASSQMALNGGVTHTRLISLSAQILAKVMYSGSETESWCILFNRSSDGRWPRKDRPAPFVLRLPDTRPRVPLAKTRRNVFPQIYPRFDTRSHKTIWSSRTGLHYFDKIAVAGQF